MNDIQSIPSLILLEHIERKTVTMTSATISGEDRLRYTTWKFAESAIPQVLMDEAIFLELVRELSHYRETVFTGFPS